MIYTVYAEKDDLTFIMEKKVQGTMESLTVKGFYFGEPNDFYTEQFCDELTQEYPVD